MCYLAILFVLLVLPQINKAQSNLRNLQSLKVTVKIADDFIGAGHSEQVIELRLAEITIADDGNAQGNLLITINGFVNEFGYTFCVSLLLMEPVIYPRLNNDSGLAMT